MAGREVLGRQTSSGGRSLRHDSGSPKRLLGESPTPTGLRATPPRGSGFPNIPLPVRPSSAPEITIDGDDEAETRLYRPRADATISIRGTTTTSGFSSDRPSRAKLAMSSRPGALIAIPVDVPSVRMRLDSDIEMKDSSISQAALVMPPRQRESSLFMKMLVVVLALTVLALTAHEIAALFHLPWLDPKNLPKVFAALRRRF
jgi:hypothetical protein